MDENGHRNSEFAHLKMVIVHSYVKLREGTWFDSSVQLAQIGSAMSWGVKSCLIEHFHIPMNLDKLAASLAEPTLQLMVVGNWTLSHVSSWKSFEFAQESLWYPCLTVWHPPDRSLMHQADRHWGGWLSFFLLHQLGCAHKCFRKLNNWT